jgi:3'(2'), 5'-bisphosphate nucleotidase
MRDFMDQFTLCIMSQELHMQRSNNELARELAQICMNAGAAILKIYNQTPQHLLLSNAKADGSPLSTADQAAENIVIEALSLRFPGIQIVAEESHYLSSSPAANKRFFLVDALDGTREFIERRPEFTVNIALIENGKPVIGAVYSPASGELYLGGTSAFSGIVDVSQDVEQAKLPILKRIGARPRQTPLKATISRAHMDEKTSRFLEECNVQETLIVGSSIKFCRIAEGLADIYPRFSPTMEWDTAAGHAIVNAAGGTVLMPDGTPLIYGKQGYANGPFIAWGK